MTEISEARIAEIREKVKSRPITYPGRDITTLLAALDAVKAERDRMKAALEARDDRSRIHRHRCNRTNI